MARKGRIGIREIEALTPGETIWDTAVAGFGARRQQGAAVAYILKYRTAEGRQRWYTIGRHDAPWKPETARKRAQALLGAVAKEQDPAADKQEKRKATTVAALCDLYIEDAEAGRVLKRGGIPKKASTLAIDRGRIAHHIKPLLGNLSVRAVISKDIERFLHDVAKGKAVKRKVKTKPRGLARVAGGKTAANRSVGLLGAIFTYAVRQGIRSDNPVRGVEKFADNRRERRLSDDEYPVFGDALRKAEVEKLWPPAVALARFLAVTGWRRGEAAALTWPEVDLARRTATLGDTKTGRSMRPLARRAIDVLDEMAKLGDGTGLVFPATRGDGGVDKSFWRRIAKTLPQDVTPHVLRHSFASVASDLGYSEPTVAAMLGHKGRSTTSRYVHSADAVLLAAADKVAEAIAQLMGDAKEPATVVDLRAAAQR